MSGMTARERNKSLQAMIDAIIDDDTKTAEALLRLQVADRMVHGEIEPEEDLSKWYQDGVEGI